MKVPADALYGAQTARAIENFPVSDLRFPRIFIRALGLIKAASAEVNNELGLLDPGISLVVARAAKEVADGKWDDQFPIDIFQTGSGTSTNMNANEVIANCAMQLQMTNDRPQKIHPNDHVNMGQSSNDVIPSAIHLSVCLQLHELLLPALRRLEKAFETRAHECSGLIKTGRTHLMDAMPLTLGQELGGWAFQTEKQIQLIESCMRGLYALALGGTAVGTGVNSHPGFGKKTASRIAEYTGLPFTESENHFASQSSMDGVTALSGCLKTAASALMKIANDLRLMNSGPVTGFGEIALPALQPGSSIMPGKVNPVICESVIMVCAQVIANDTAVTTGNSLGNFQLNTMLPLIAHNILQSITILGNVVTLFADKAVSGFQVNTDRISETAGRNPILATVLVPLIGYEKTAEVVKKAVVEKMSILDAAQAISGLDPGELKKLLAQDTMI